MLLVLDQDIVPRLTADLAKRGREATSVQRLRLRGTKDPPLLKRLNHEFGRGNWVLVTGDDRMPETHADAVKAEGATIATIDPNRPAFWARDDQTWQWRIEVVHRWTHMMCSQEPGSLFRYGAVRRTVWTPRVRKKARRSPPKANRAVAAQDARPPTASRTEKPARPRRKREAQGQARLDLR